MIKRITSFSLVLSCILVVVACTPGTSITIPPDMTLMPGTDIPQQVATYVANAFTQTAVLSATDMPYVARPITPVGTEAGSSSGTTSLILYQSSTLGIQFSYPATWYRQEMPEGVVIASFEPTNRPPESDWTYDTTHMQFGFKVFVTPPGSFDEWIESARQAATTNELIILEEEPFAIANQSAHRLTLVSNSGKVVNQVLAILDGRYIDINVEGNYQNNLARTVLYSIQPYSSSGLKPVDYQVPASGICGDALGDPANIILGTDGGGIPLAGRCLTIQPWQRIRLVNQANVPFTYKFGDFVFNLPIDGKLLLDKPVGQYLSVGIHTLPRGPELWVMESFPTSTVTPIPTMPGPFRNYSNTEVGYSLTVPPGWSVDEYGLSNPNKEVFFSPGNPENFIAYLSISLDFRTLEQIKNFYAQNAPDAFYEDVVFNGYSGIKYTYNWGRAEYFIPHQGGLLLILTDRSNDNDIQQMLGSIRLTSSTTTTEVTLADNSATFHLHVGDRIWLNLDSGYDWSVSFGDPTVVGSAEYLYAYALSSGVSSVTALGNPKCANSTPPCLAPSLIFTITVIVQ